MAEKASTKSSIHPITKSPVAPISPSSLILFYGEDASWRGTGGTSREMISVILDRKQCLQPDPEDLWIAGCYGGSEEGGSMPVARSSQFGSLFVHNSSQAAIQCIYVQMASRLMNLASLIRCHVHVDQPYLLHQAARCNFEWGWHMAFQKANAHSAQQKIGWLPKRIYAAASSPGRSSS